MALFYIRREPWCQFVVDEKACPIRSIAALTTPRPFRWTTTRRSRLEVPPTSARAFLPGPPGKVAPLQNVLQGGSLEQQRWLLRPESVGAVSVVGRGRGRERRRRPAEARRWTRARSSRGHGPPVNVTSLCGWGGLGGLAPPVARRRREIFGRFERF